jgi:hypothetical protein
MGIKDAGRQVEVEVRDRKMNVNGKEKRVLVLSIDIYLGISGEWQPQAPKATQPDCASVAVR